MLEDLESWEKKRILKEEKGVLGEALRSPRRAGGEGCAWRRPARGRDPQAAPATSCGGGGWLAWCCRCPLQRNTWRRSRRTAGIGGTCARCLRAAGGARDPRAAGAPAPLEGRRSTSTAGLRHRATAGPRKTRDRPVWPTVRSSDAGIISPPSRLDGSIHGHGCGCAHAPRVKVRSVLMFFDG